MFLKHKSILDGDEILCEKQRYEMPLASAMSCHDNANGRAYERGVREVHRTRTREVLGLGRMKLRGLSFSVIKPKITSVQGSCQCHA